MRRLELVLSCFQSMQTSLLTGIFFMTYLLVFMEASMLTIFLFASKLYVFGVLILGFFFVVSIVAGLKMRKLNKQSKKFREQLDELGVDLK